MSPLRTFLLGGLLPVLTYAVVEYIWGTVAGLIAGIVLGVIELGFEYWTMKRVHTVTVVSNALVIILGGVSLLESNSSFFKLQPAILALAFAAFMLVTSALGKPFLLEIVKKQRSDIPEPVLAHLSKMNVRVGICMILAGLVGVHAAFYWSTAAWATYKAIGAPLVLLGYLVLDIGLLKLRQRRAANEVEK